jgi:hypothetical protein
MENSNTQLEAIKVAPDLKSLNSILTSAMAKQQIQDVIKDGDLGAVVEAILSLARDEGSAGRFLAASMLGRLAAVTRKQDRKAPIFDRISDLLVEEPPPIDSLADDKEKGYAASVLRYATGIWLTDYCASQVLKIESADLARREILLVLLERKETVAELLNVIAEKANLLHHFENSDSRLKRVRKIFAQLQSVVSEHQGELGKHSGEALANLAKAFLNFRLHDADENVLHDVLDSLFSILTRMIELRFSVALEAETYAVVDVAKRLVGALEWGRFLSASSKIQKVRLGMLESALVLARQNRTDSRILDIMVAAYTSRPQISAAVKRHFINAQDLDPAVREWWSNGGAVSELQKKTEHTIGNSEDQHIGTLLVEVESNQDAMEKLLRAVVPFLEISDPVLASTVEKAALGYIETAQIAKRLARMRKLSTTDLKGRRLEYNPLEHEMLGGHRGGVRLVRVVRDGVQKDFAGRIKTLVKPWVESIE